MSYISTIQRILVLLKIIIIFLFSGSGPILMSLSLLFIAVPLVIFGSGWANIAFQDNVEVIITMVVYFSIGSIAIIAFFVDLILNAVDFTMKGDSQMLKFIKELYQKQIPKTNAGMIIRFLLFILFASGYTHNTFTYAEHLHSDRVKSSFITSYLAVSIFFIWAQVIVLIFLQYYDKKISNGGKVLRMIIIITNACSWLNAYFFESSEIFERHDINENKTVSSNLTEDKCFENADIVEVIFAPVTIEYTMMAIGFLFPVALEDVRYSRSWKMTVLISAFLIIYEAGVLVFSLQVVLKCTFIDDSNGVPLEFTFYVVLVAILFAAMIGLLIACIILKRMSKLKRSNDHSIHIENFTLLVTAFGNNLYHLLNAIAVVELESISLTHKTITFGQNILGLSLAFLQTWFLLAINRYEVTNEQVHNISRDSGCTCHAKNSLKHSCFALAVMNFGLWMYGSIAEIREPVFTYLQQQYYSGPSWNVILKIIFPLTVFYRFHSSMDFLKLWLHFAKDDK